jgi:glycosyltransferase involved in cell wall biosynthesis
MKMPYFSVIIPLYNKEKYVENALKSILDQTFSDFEVLIVNDCSTDKSVSKIEPYLDEKVKLIHHEKNKGLSATRNTGILNAKADYVTYLDADDVWKPTFLETIHRLTINFTEAKIFATNYDEVYKKNTFTPFNGAHLLKENTDSIVDFFKIDIKQGLYHHGSICFHKDVFKKAGYYDENIRFSEDFDFNIRANYYFKLAYSNTNQMSYYLEIENQITGSSILNFQVPDYDKYENWAKTNPNLKKQLDFLRYVLAKKLKKDGDKNRWKKIIKPIQLKNLNWKQIVLIYSPRSILLLLDKIKMNLINKGIKIATYSNKR